VLSEKQRGSQFTCFTGTKVQILTPEELRSALGEAARYSVLEVR
jgi:hypothetical protein